MVTVVSLSSRDLSQAARAKALPDLEVPPFPTYPVPPYLLEQLHGVSGGEGRRGRGAGTPVVMAGGRDAVHRAPSVVVAFQCVAKTQRPLSVSCLDRIRTAPWGTASVV